MPYFAPYIDSTGYHTSTYQDTEDNIVNLAKSIWGEDIYLEDDSQDFQFIAALSKLLYDTSQVGLLAYNNRSPVTAVGVGLDAIVALNGITRNTDRNSTAVVNITGTAFTTISNGVVADINGHLWDLPSLVTIGVSGTVSTTIVAQEPGPISALENQINIIITPTSGWDTVTNLNVAVVGRSVESDAELRARQKISVSNPSQALSTGILGSVLDIENVISAQLYENDTNIALSLINLVQNPALYPAHSITVVVEGGDNSEIANIIASRKTPGAYTNGNTSVIVIDRYNVPTTIRFERPVNIVIDVEITIIPLTGYNDSVRDNLENSVLNYINSMVAGQRVIRSEIIQAGLESDNVGPPKFSLSELRIALHGDPLGVADIVPYFNQKATTVIGNIDTMVVL